MVGLFKTLAKIHYHITCSLITSNPKTQERIIIFYQLFIEVEMDACGNLICSTIQKSSYPPEVNNYCIFDGILGSF